VPVNLASSLTEDIVDDPVDLGGSAEAALTAAQGTEAQSGSGAHVALVLENVEGGREILSIDDPEDEESSEAAGPAAAAGPSSDNSTSSQPAESTQGTAAADVVSTETQVPADSSGDAPTDTASSIAIEQSGTDQPSNAVASENGIQAPEAASQQEEIPQCAEPEPIQAAPATNVVLALHATERSPDLYESNATPHLPDIDSSDGDADLAQAAAIQGKEHSDPADRGQVVAAASDIDAGTSSQA
jgi:hypothetical protein